MAAMNQKFTHQRHTRLGLSAYYLAPEREKQ